MRDETGCYIWFGLFVLGIGTYIIEVYWTEIFWFLFWTIPIILGAVVLVYVFDFLHSLYLFCTFSFYKEIMSLDTKRIVCDTEENLKNKCIVHPHKNEIFILTTKIFEV